MQWLKDRAGRTSSKIDDNQLVVGSDNMGRASSRNPIAPMGSFKDPESAQSAVQSSNQQPNPYVQQSAPGESNAGGAEEEEEVDVLSASQVLVTIPGAVVHLIDDEESVHLATGDFSLVRLFQEKTKVVVIVQVGEDLKWPLVQDEPAVKIDPTHYYFTLKVPKDMEDDDDTPASTDAATEVDVLNYGVTFPAGLGDDQAARIRELDYFLERYSTFSDPTVVQGDGIDEHTRKEIESENNPDKVVPASTLAGDGLEVANEDTSAAFWTTVAPQVSDYNSFAAKGIAMGAGHIIRGIFWVGESTEKSLTSSHSFMKSKFKPKKDKTKIRPITMGSVRNVRKLSAMTDKVTRGVLGGILYTTGLVSTAVVNSPGGKIFFKMMPGEVALVSLEAFGKMFDAIELAGTGVVAKSHHVTQDFVNYRYGESAKELTDEGFQAFGHAASTVWTITKIRKALNPKKKNRRQNLEIRHCKISSQVSCVWQEGMIPLGGQKVKLCPV